MSIIIIQVINFNSMFKYKSQHQKSNNELRILDYRNGKYQGTTKGLQMVRDGLGMILDHNYLFAIAAWKEGIADG